MLIIIKYESEKLMFIIEIKKKITFYPFYL